MNTDLLLKIVDLVKKCPKCKNESLEDENSLEVSKNSIIRKCDCGYTLVLSINESMTEPKEIDLDKYNGETFIQRK